MASPPNFLHFHCYFGHSWSRFTAERSQRTHCCPRKSHTRVHREWHLLKPNWPGYYGRGVRNATHLAYSEPCGSRGRAAASESRWNRSNVTFAWWPRRAVSIHCFDSCIARLAPTTARLGTAHRHMAWRRSDTDLRSFTVLLGSDNRQILKWPRICPISSTFVFNEKEKGYTMHLKIWTKASHKEIQSCGINTKGTGLLCRSHIGAVSTQ